MKITLKAARVNAGYTQHEVARQLNLTPRTLINYEKGVSFPRNDMILKIAFLYRIDVENIKKPKPKKNK